MTKSILVLASVTFLIGIARPLAAEAGESFASAVRGNIANQEIAGFPSSLATWSVERGRVAIHRLEGAEALVVVHTKGLIIPALGFNPSPDLLARIVCHDSTGTPSEAGRTRTVPLPQSGDARLVDTVSLPDDCFAPIVLLTGSIDPQGESPGKFFGVSAL